ncbi:MAG: hypothetical protein WC976_06490 [Caldisericia bacterium]
MQIFYYKGLGSCQSKCGVTILDGTNNKKIVVLTELPDNPGTSVTNFAEGIASAVVRDLLPEALAYAIKWVEHYPSESRGGDEETFDNIEMEWDGGRGYVERPGNFHNPKWSPMAKEEAAKIKKQI